MKTRSRGKLVRRAARGMTLVEIMVVVAIIGMLMGTVGVYAYGQLEKARDKDTRMVIHNVEQALVHFQTDNPDCPKSINDLVAGKYMQKEPKDGWGQPLRFVCPGTHGNSDSADIWSTGKNKQDENGAGDDISSWTM